MDVPARKSYPSDLTDAQWEILEPLIPASKRGGRPREVDMREVMNAILYLNRTGSRWDVLPHDLLPKCTVYDYFATWRDDGTWQRFLDALRSEVRVRDGRQPTPSAASIDSQSVKTTEIGGVRSCAAIGNRLASARRQGIHALPKRWVAERTFAWNGRGRRHSKDYERRLESSESMIRVTAIHRMLRRLAPPAKRVAFHYQNSA